MTERPSLRALAGMLVLVFGLVLYALLVMQGGAAMAHSPITIQTAYYVLAGLVWLWPARLLLRWIARRPD